MQDLPPILFEDETLIAFDKPGGLLVVPDRWDKDLTNLMQIVHEKLSAGISNVHRLDRETSGVFLCTKTKMALDDLSGQFQSKHVKKRYVAITLGVMPDDEMAVRKPILEDEHRPGKMRVGKKSGKPSETLLRTLTRWRGYSLVEAFPITGRTHQIRVHLAFLGCPVLADPLYGDGNGLMLSAIKGDYKHKSEPERPLLGRLALHAESITFTHPANHQVMTIRSPLPKTFEVAIKYLRRYAGM